MGSDAGINVMPLDDMLPMVGSSGGKFAMKFNPEHPQHGWIFYDNHGQWVTLRRALPHEVELAKAIIEMRKYSPNVAIEGPEQAQLANGPSRMESSAS